MSQWVNGSMHFPIYPRARRRGLTLLSAALSLTLIAAALTIAATGLAASLKAVRYAQHATLASQLAENEMEQLKAQPFASLRSGEQALSPLGLSALPSGKATLSVEKYPIAGVKQVTVTVTWQEFEGAERRVRLVTLISPYGK